MLANCCFCVKLRTGGIVIGILTALIGLAQIIDNGVNIHGSQNQTSNTTSIIISALYIISGICLVVGALKYKNNLIMAWLFIHLVFTINYVVQVFFNSNHVGQTVGEIIVGLVLAIYFLLCVYSLYLENKR